MTLRLIDKTGSDAKILPIGSGSRFKTLDAVRFRDRKSSPTGR